MAVPCRIVEAVREARLRGQLRRDAATVAPTSRCATQSRS